MNQTINHDDLHNDQTIILQSTSTRDYKSNDKIDLPERQQITRNSSHLVTYSIFNKDTINTRKKPQSPVITPTNF